MAVYALRKPRVTRDGIVTRLRAFPAIGEPGPGPGTEVQWDTVLGMYASRQRLRFVRVEVSGDRIAATVLVGVGQKVKRGEVLAYYSYLFGLGYTEYTTPCDGEIVSIGQVTGTIAVKEALVPLRSNMPGRVEATDEALGAWVTSRGDLVACLLGAGYGRSGVLAMKVARPEDEARPQDIGLADAGKVLVVGRRVTQEVMEACLKYRVAGVVAGSAQNRVYGWYKDLAEKLDWDELLARYWARELKERDAVAPPPMEIVPALVITEGFGEAPMSGESFGLLVGHAGEKVFIDGGGAFQSKAGAESQPCVFAPERGSGPAAGVTTVRGLDQVNPGDTVRVAGLLGPSEAKALEVSEEDVSFESGIAAPGVRVQTAAGETIWVPVFNVEKTD